MMTHVERIIPLVKLDLKLQCSNAYFLASGTITVPNIGTVANPKNRKNIIIISFAPFTDWIVEINGTQIDNANEIHIVMSIYNLIQYSDNYCATPGSLWQYYTDESFLDNNGTIANFPADNNNSA